MTDRESRRREALIQAGLALASELSLPSVLQKIVDLACEVSDARYGALGVLARGGRRIEDFVTHGVTEEERRAIGDLPLGRGILGALIEEGKPLRLEHIQDDPRSVGFPPNHPRMTTFLGVPIEIHGRVFGNLYLTEKRGGEPFDADDEAAVATLAAQAGVAIENARLYREATRHARRLSALNEVNRRILEGGEPDDVLGLIAELAREMVGAKLATVVTPHAEPGALLVRVATGERAEELVGTTCPAAGSISQEVMETGRPTLVPDLSSDPRVHQPVVRIGGVGPGLFVPLGTAGHAHGTLLVANPRGADAFAEEDVDVLRLFAAQAALAVEHASLREELKRLAVLEDRERIAQELHDGVIQSLFAVGMSLQAMESAGDEAIVRRRIGQAVDAIDDAIRDLRNYIFGLRPGAAADRTLERALHELAEGFAPGTEAKIAVEVEARAASLLSGRAADLVQAAREALSNALRHSGASAVSIRLAHADGGAVLEVADDGSGFDPERARGRGHGLESLRARAEALGGELDIESGDGGTAVRIRVPL